MQPRSNSMSHINKLNLPHLPWRTIITALGFIATAALAQQNTPRADGYPARPIRIVLGIAPGGGTDIVARAVGQKLAERWGKSVVVDNRPGASGAIAFDLVAQAAPDGYTHYLGTLSNVVIATLIKTVAFDTRKAYTPVVQMTMNQPHHAPAGNDGQASRRWRGAGAAQHAGGI